MKQLRGKLRRCWLTSCRPGYVMAQLRRRSGACARCGACCRLGWPCLFLSPKSECRLYGGPRPASCVYFPIDERDIEDAGGRCGFSFAAESSPQQPAALPKPTWLRRGRLRSVVLLLAVLGAYGATAASLAVGALVFGVGLALTVWGGLGLVRSDELDEGEPDAPSRHPLYVGNGLLDWGLCVMTGNWWLIALYPVAFYVAYTPTVLAEDERLRTLRARRLRGEGASAAGAAPNAPRSPGSRGGGVTWSNLFSHHVASRAIRHLAYPVLILLARRVWLHPMDTFVADVPLAAAFAAALILSRVIYFGPERKRADGPAQA